jgi:hypothetical protein
MRAAAATALAGQHGGEGGASLRQLVAVPGGVVRHRGPCGARSSGIGVGAAARATSFPSGLRRLVWSCPATSPYRRGSGPRLRQAIAAAGPPLRQAVAAAPVPVDTAAPPLRQHRDVWAYPPSQPIKSGVGLVALL